MLSVTQTHDGNNDMQRCIEEKIFGYLGTNLVHQKGLCLSLDSANNADMLVGNVLISNDLCELQTK